MELIRKTEVNASWRDPRGLDLQRTLGRTIAEDRILEPSGREPADRALSEFAEGAFAAAHHDQALRRRQGVQRFALTDTTVHLEADSADAVLAAEQFRLARAHYDQGRLEAASHSLSLALQHDPANALYTYIMAITQYQMQWYEQAEQSVSRALELEKQRPLESWGRQMEPYQGRSRLWLEQRRSQLNGS